MKTFLGGTVKNAELREKLRVLLCQEAVSRGQFRLSSGKTSDYYVDGKMVTLSPEGAYLAAKLILDQLGRDVDAVGGLMIGAVPMAGAIAALSYAEGRPMTTFFVRKRPKKHGQSKWLEGPLRQGARVVIVDDVITTGRSVLKAIRRVEQAGCTVAKVIALVDRGEGGREALNSRGYVFEALFASSDLGIDRGEPSRVSAEAA